MVKKEKNQLSRFNTCLFVLIDTDNCRFVLTVVFRMRLSEGISNAVIIACIVEVVAVAVIARMQLMLS